MSSINIAQWNANGILKHRNELEIFLRENNIDVMLLVETHLCSKNNRFKINGYNTHLQNNPEDKPCGGTAVLVRNRLRYSPVPSVNSKFIQSSVVEITDQNQKIIRLAAVYCPPKSKISENQFSEFFNTLGPRFFAAGDFNAKSPHWASRLTTPRGKQLLNAVYKNNLHCISGGLPTYWPSDPHKIPDCIDFGIFKSLNPNRIRATTTIDLSSDHSPTIFVLRLTATNFQEEDKLNTNKTNWHKFQKLFNKNFCSQIRLKTQTDIDNALQYLTSTILECIELATPNHKSPKISHPDTSQNVQELLKAKRKAKREWQKLRSPRTKAILNKATKTLRQELIKERNENIQKFVLGLSHLADTNYAVWKTTRRIKKSIQAETPIQSQQGAWIISNQQKAEAFAKYFEKVFKTEGGDSTPPDIPNHHTTNPSTPLKFNFSDLLKKLKVTNPKKTPGHDCISGKMLKELPLSGKSAILFIFNAILRLNYYPDTWKHARITVIPKPGKDMKKIESYRPISLLPTLSKLFEKLLFDKILKVIEKKDIIPSHQFGFRQKHGTIEQIHKIVNNIKQALERKEYCVGIFLDIAQAFDQVWHKGLKIKITALLPKEFHAILFSYLDSRNFKVKYKDALSSTHYIEAGVPQGSVLGPLLYLFYTSDLPTNNKMLTTTFADDTAILYSHPNPLTAVREIQGHINTIMNWAKTWKISVNVNKTQQITFTLRKRTCRPVTINGNKVNLSNVVKYLGLYLDRRLTWKSHIEHKRNQIKIQFRKLYWLMHKKSKLNTLTKIMVYKSILKPIWTYGLQLWGTAKKSNINIIERVQTKIIRSILGAPRYVKNEIILRDTNTLKVAKEAKKYSKKYIKRLANHPNTTAKDILLSNNYARLKRTDPLQLANLQ